MTPTAVATGYRNLILAERGFRDMKSTLNLRPVFHHLEPRIRSHVLLCWLALLLIRVAENRTNMTWDHINTVMSRMHQITMRGPAGTFTQTTEPTTAQKAILTACAASTPPRISAITPH